MVESDIARALEGQCQATATQSEPTGVPRGVLAPRHGLLRWRGGRGGFRRACASGRVAPAPSLRLRSAVAEARTVSDPARNAKLSKGSQGGRRLPARGRRRLCRDPHRRRGCTAVSRSGSSASGRCARAGRVRRLASLTTGEASRDSLALPYQALPTAATPCPTEPCQVIPGRARSKRPQAKPPSRQALQEQLWAAITSGASVPADGSAPDGRSSTATTTGADHADVQAG